MYLKRSTLHGTCPHCGSMSYTPTNASSIVEMEAVCNQCQHLFAFDKRSSTSLTDDSNICPHCHENGGFLVADGIEACLKCGMDVDKSQPSSKLARFWKKGSQIQRAMHNDVKILEAGSEMGDFLRKHCGPHCSSGSACEQKMSTLKVCTSAENDEDAVQLPIICLPGVSGGLFSSRKTTYISKPAAYFSYSQGGWFQKYMDGETYGVKNSEQAGDNES